MTSNIHPSVANGITIVSSFRTRRQVARKRGAYTDRPVTGRKERESRLPGCRFQNGIIGRLRWVAFGATVWGNRGTLAPDSCRVSRPRSLASPLSSPPFLLPSHRSLSLSLSFFPTTYLRSLLSLSLSSLARSPSFFRSVPFSLSLSPSPSRFQVIRKHLFLSPPYAEHLLVFFPRSLALSFPLRFHKQRASLGLHMCIREASIYVCGTDWLELNSVFYWFILALGLSVALGGARSTGDDRSKRVVAVSSRESRNGRFMAASRHHRTPLGERSSDVDEENATSGLDPNICIYIYLYSWIDWKILFQANFVSFVLI